MIVVRNVFQLKFGKAREAVAVMKEGVAIQKRLAAEGSARLLTDVTGRHYTLVLEMTLPNLAALEARRPGSLATRTFRRTIKRWCRWWSPATARFSQSSSSARHRHGRFGRRCAQVRAFQPGALVVAITAMGVLAAGENRPQTPTSQAGSPILFENVTDASGLSFVLDQHPTPDKHMVETMAGGLAVFDYDGDGRPDIFFTNGAPLPSLRQGRRRTTGTAVPQRRRSAIHRRHRAGRRARRRLLDRGGRRRLRQRRHDRSLRRRRAAQPAVPQPRRRPFEDVTAHGRHQELHVVGRGRLVRLRQRRLARPVRRQLRGLDAGGEQVLRRSREDLRVYCHPKHYARAAERALPQPSRRHVRGRLGAVGHRAGTSARA